MPSDRLPPLSVLVVGIVVGFFVAAGLQLWGPEWHGGIVLGLVAAVAGGAMLSASRWLERVE
ncbi:hypothetical protein OB955_10975 [Halobacteria archaeon AArc-m2/3/4]|uniref:Uncharacterized protein n=1 Tax=Natronoglomus mannanivorans TaxID=2979990 RepID=A0AAP2YZ80_9EURY|nr:hypothetical protein [Halobacteria archaeon AArc-xg1-1]MCU4973264.1 hypothetical protein [Halobacteria archaeon AArc-m2/3/4]